MHIIFLIKVHNFLTNFDYTYLKLCTGRQDFLLYHFSIFKLVATFLCVCVCVFFFFFFFFCFLFCFSFVFSFYKRFHRFVWTEDNSLANAQPPCLAYAVSAAWFMFLLGRSLRVAAQWLWSHACNNTQYMMILVDGHISLCLAAWPPLIWEYRRF